jgi:hypothetical protein
MDRFDVLCPGQSLKATETSSRVIDLKVVSSTFKFLNNATLFVVIFNAKNIFACCLSPKTSSNRLIAATPAGSLTGIRQALGHRGSSDDLLMLLLNPLANSSSNTALFLTLLQGTTGLRCTCCPIPFGSTTRLSIRRRGRLRSFITFTSNAPSPSWDLCPSLLNLLSSPLCLYWFRNWGSWQCRLDWLAGLGVNAPSFHLLRSGVNSRCLFPLG